MSSDSLLDIVAESGPIRYYYRPNLLLHPRLVITRLRICERHYLDWGFAPVWIPLLEPPYTDDEPKVCDVCLVERASGQDNVANVREWAMRVGATG